MLFNLLLANITVLLCFFFLFRVVFQFLQFLRLLKLLKLAVAIPTGALITVVNDAIEMLPLVAHKTIKDLSKQSKEAIYLLSFYSLILFL